MPKTHINDVAIDIFLEAIENIETSASSSVNPNERDRLLNNLPVFIRVVVEEVMSQDGYPDNIDWDIVTEDGGLSLIAGN